MSALFIVGHSIRLPYFKPIFGKVECKHKGIIIFEPKPWFYAVVKSSKVPPEMVNPVPLKI